MLKYHIPDKSYTLTTDGSKRDGESEVVCHTFYYKEMMTGYFTLYALAVKSLRPN